VGPEILTAPDLTYAASFALINTELLALVNLRTNTLDVHRIPEGGSCVLQRVGQLSLPFSQTGIPSLSASFQPVHPYPPLYSSRRCLPFHPSPDACLVGLTAIAAAQDGTMTFYWLAIRPDYLCSIADAKQDSDSDRPTSWETWSLRTACCFEIEHLLAAPIPAGARWLVDSQSLVVREFGLSRSRKIQADQRTHYGGIVDNNVPREEHQDVFASQLPYCDVEVRMGEKKYQSVIADYEWVVGMNDEVRSAPLYNSSMTSHSYNAGWWFFRNDTLYRYPSCRIDSY
jgi:hypothetical protein